MPQPIGKVEVGAMAQPLNTIQNTKLDIDSIGTSNLYQQQPTVSIKMSD